MKLKIKEVFLNPSSKLNKSRTIIEWENFQRQNDLKVQPERLWNEVISVNAKLIHACNEPNFDANYILDVGDVLSISIFDQDTKEVYRRN